MMGDEEFLMKIDVYRPLDRGIEHSLSDDAYDVFKGTPAAHVARVGAIHG